MSALKFACCSANTKYREILSLIFVKHSLGRTHVFEWETHFKADTVSVQDEELKASNCRQNARIGGEIRELKYQ